MEWISVKDKMPTESDNLILVTNGRHTEIVWMSDEEKAIKKPFAYDEHDTPLFSIGSVTYWMPLPEPPKE
jgi:hypothetical protein